MSKEVLQAIKAICDEKHIPVESVMATIEQALAAAYRKDFGNRLQNLKVEFNPANMHIRVYDIKTVVEDQELPTEEELAALAAMPVGHNTTPQNHPLTPPWKGGDDSKEEGIIAGEEEIKRFNPKTEIMISEAQKTKPDAVLGEEIITELPLPGEFGRMAAQTAKQVIIQRLREAERDVIFKEYKDKEGAMINGTVQRTEGNMVLVDIGQATAVMPINEQARNERYLSGATMRFYIKSVATSSRGPEVVVSRADRELVRQLFTMEVPEIGDGVVEIKSLAREAGSRTKVAVSSKQDNVDPVGSCVGQRGSRVQFIINELAGEKIDIIQWEEDDKKFIKSALSPAKVVDVELNEVNRLATALVAEDQLSLAIGKQGQNVRLASALTGWKIDIKQAGGDVVKIEEAEVASEPVVESTEAPPAETIVQEEIKTEESSSVIPAPEPESSSPEASSE